jgi:hypothetical protein
MQHADACQAKQGQGASCIAVPPWSGVHSSGWTGFLGAPVRTISEDCCPSEMDGKAGGSTNHLWILVSEANKFGQAFRQLH